MRSVLFPFLITIVLILTFGLNYQRDNLYPIAIITYNSDSSIFKTIIQSFKEEVARSSLVENQNITYIETSINNNRFALPQVVAALRIKRPAVVIALTTPVAQIAKSMINNTPIIYGMVSDPVSVELIEKSNRINNSIVGVSDMQDISILVSFIQTSFKNTKRIGFMYYKEDIDDLIILERMKEEAKKYYNVKIVEIAIPSTEREKVAPVTKHLMQQVDLVYIGKSCSIQRLVSYVFGVASEMNLPIISMNEDNVRSGIAVASFSVDYRAVGIQLARLSACKILHSCSNKSAYFEKLLEQSSQRLVVSKSLAKAFSVQIPENALVLE